MATAIKELSKKDRKGAIADLLRKLEKSKSDKEGRAIRQRLRTLGHKGGLGDN